jgi:hypothetical protein
MVEAWEEKIQSFVQIFGAQHNGKCTPALCGRPEFVAVPANWVTSICWNVGVEFQLRYLPWSDRGLIPQDVFLREVEDALATAGRWETYGEYRMGAGPTVSVTVVSEGDRTTYRAEAVWMSWAFKLTWDYDSLERALIALPMFGDALFRILSDGGWEGLVDR